MLSNFGKDLRKGSAVWLSLFQFYSFILITNRSSTASTVAR